MATPHIEVNDKNLFAKTVLMPGDPLRAEYIAKTYLTDEEKVEVCRCASLAGAQFVKTSTGFGTGGATAADIKLMRETVGAEMGVKASGGVRTYNDLKVMVENGATRIGASSGIQIMKDASNVGE